PRIPAGHDVFDQPVRAAAACQIRNDDQGTGSNQGLSNVADEDGAPLPGLQSLENLGGGAQVRPVVTLREMLVQVQQQRQVRGAGVPNLEGSRLHPNTDASPWEWPQWG